MKTWYLVPFALLLGLLIGRWFPNDDVRVSQPNAAKEGRGRAAEKPVAKAPGLDELTRMMKIPDRASRPVQQLATNRTEEAKAGSVTNAPGAAKPARPQTPEDLQARIEEAQALWKTRVDIARAQMLDQLGLVGNAEKCEAFDATINEMNQALLETMQMMAADLKNGAEASPELGMRALAQMTTSMAATYERLGDVVDADKRAALSSMQMHDFIDPGVISPLIEVQDKMQGFQAGPQGPFSGRRKKEAATP